MGARGDAESGGPARPTTRAGLRRIWREGGRTWEAAAPLVAPRNLAIARAYLETDEPIRALGRRYGLADTRIAAIARRVVYRTLGRRLPGR